MPAFSAARPPFRVAFFGSDAFSVAIFRGLMQRKAELVRDVVVVTPADKPSGRHLAVHAVPLKKHALEANVPVVQPEGRSLRAFSLPNPSWDLGVVASFGLFIPPSIIESCRFGAINVHPSLLPRHRGPAPIAWSILNGDCTTGVSIQTVDPNGFDTGQILRQAAYKIEPSSVDACSLESCLAALGSELLIDTLGTLSEARSVADNSDALATHAPKLSPADVSIDRWHAQDEQGHAKWTALRIDRLSRAIGHKLPVRTWFRSKLMHLLDPRRVDGIPFAAANDVSAQPGDLHITGDGAYVRCADGQPDSALWIRFTRVKVEGKRECSVPDWANGYGLHRGQHRLGAEEN